MSDATHQPARRPQMGDGGICNDPIVWFANHLDTSKGGSYDGFLVPMNQDKRDNGVELDEFLRGLGQEVVEIDHTNAKKKYWALPSLDAFVIANGVQSWSEIKLDTDPATSAFVRYGIAACWNDFQRSSMLRFRCLPTAWLAAGWTHPITFSANSYSVLDVLRALTRHFDLLDMIDAARKEQSRAPLNPPYYEVSVELVPGARIMRGKDKQTKVTPIVTGVPDNVDIDYVRKHYIKSDWKDVVGALVPQTLLWSVQESKRMASFKKDDQNGQGATPATNGARPAAATRNVPQAVGAGDYQGDEDLPF